MKKMLTAALLLGFAHYNIAASNKAVTVHETDISIAKALQIVNQQCDTKIDENILMQPENTISLDFEKTPCQAVIKLILQYDQGGAV